MATSERILTAVPSAANVQRVVLHPSLNVPHQPVWRQVVLDFVTISLCLTLVPALFGESFIDRGPHALLFPQASLPYVLALMVTTVFAFAGAYPRRQSPVDITDTEGLMRGVACTVILLSIASLSSRIAPDGCVVLTVCLAIALLVIQRELGHVLKRPGRVAASSSTQLSFAGTVFRVGNAAATSEFVSSFEVAHGESPAGYLLKRTLDIVLAASVLILVTPMLLMVAALITLDSRGPLLIRQRRIGRNGRAFFMWKFRSMHAGVELYAYSPVSDTDPRLTRFGRSLRRLSIDELPQLLNVLKGDMSLVGPRPEMPFIVKKYTPHERLRLNALPGITGLWQISPARAMPIHQNLELDLFYIEHRNVFLDLAILLRTITAVVRGIGAN